MKADVYERITSEIVNQLQEGVLPWLQPWNATHAAGRITRPLRANGMPYQGVNVLSLWMAASARGYAAPIWMTFKQALDLGGAVRKGEKGNLVVYADSIIRNETDADTGEAGEKRIHFMKGYTVFNVEQVDGLPSHYYAQPPQRTEPVARIAGADAFFAATGAAIIHAGNQPCYVPSQDLIRIPAIEFFRDAESYYATLAHEITHWTRHETRLLRDFGRKRFGDEGYAMEELVAELGAAFLCSDLDLTPEPSAEHASYIASWIAVLKSDKRAIFAAASYAQRAVAFLHERQPRGAAEAA